MQTFLTHASAGYRSGGNARSDDINWDVAYTQAATILSGSQLQAFKAEAAMQQLSAKVREFYAKREAGGL